LDKIKNKSTLDLIQLKVSLAKATDPSLTSYYVSLLMAQGYI